MAHPAFAELFIDTVEDLQNRTVYARRRGKPVCAAMKACFDGDIELLTDRTQVFGRQTVLGIPSSMSEQQAERDISRALGIRTVKTVLAGKTASAAFAIAMADSQTQVRECLSAVTGEEDIKRVAHLAWTHAQVEMRYLKLTSFEAKLFQQIASRTVIKIPSVCAAQGTPQNKETLFKYGLSGETPII